MAIIPMKRLQAVVPESEKELLLKELMLLGCMEISESDPVPENFPAALALRREDPLSADASEQLETVKSALATLDAFGKAGKRGLFTPPKTISAQELDDSLRREEFLEKAQAVNQLHREIEACRADVEGLVTRKLALVPWQNLNVPLETRNLKQVHVSFGTVPAAVAPAMLEDRFHEIAPESVLTLVSSDRELHYLFLLYHHSQEQVLDEFLKSVEFSRSAFNDMKGTALSNMAAYDHQILALQEKCSQLESRLTGMKDFQEDLELCFDALTLQLRRDETRRTLLSTARTFLLTGWVPAEQTEAVARELERHACAFEFTEPAQGEEPPVAFRNSRMAAPFGIISALYGTPRYGSVVDPTPFMAPFFFIFFGMMVSDAAYGLILALAAVWALRHVKQQGFLRQLFTLVLYCGISTIIWGILFGSWFGDIVPAVSKMLTGTAVYIQPVWFDPMKQPMTMLIFSFALGGLQILIGLGLSGWRHIRSGHWQDALFDVGFWYLILIGLVLALLAIPYGLWMAASGALGVILTAGRHEKNPLKRLITGILSLYSVTGYLADVLSYSRLLALGLASAVIASVINAMGTIGGRSLGGIIALVVIFIFGHIFNLAINLVGAYVHASRLQYVEFFSKFYEGGGRPFAPFAMDTKYVQVEKEDLKTVNRS